jgi:uncharacterized protein YcgI (DUF1989 family)
VTHMVCQSFHVVSIQADKTNSCFQVNKMLTGADFDRHCHTNLVRAIEPFGLSESDVHDNVNLFQVTGMNSKSQYFM